MFYTYILYSSKLNKYYIGSTQDIANRLMRHNRGDGAKFTKLGMPWELFYLEEYNTRQEAVQREIQIKRKKSRTYIESLK